ncbi:MAG TPA: hypothetical protein VK145_00175, partial [Candidatus Nanoarchaeia archaeon]|nr:hypothetical protein [Candidatus Nanoarchaeia archaeon]
MITSTVLLVCVMTVSGVFTLKVQELTETNSVTFTPTDTYCIIHGYKYLRARIRYGQLYRQIHDQINAVEAKIGLFGSAHEPILYANYRTGCTFLQKTNGICPLSTLKTLDGEPALTRIALIMNIRQLDSLVGKVMFKFNSFPVSYKPKEPSYSDKKINIVAPWHLNVTQDSRDIPRLENQGNVYYLPLTTVKAFELAKGDT